MKPVCEQYKCPAYDVRRDGSCAAKCEKNFTREEVEARVRTMAEKYCNRCADDNGHCASDTKNKCIKEKIDYCMSHPTEEKSNDN